MTTTGMKKTTAHHRLAEVRQWMTRTGSAEFVDRGGMPLVDQTMHIVLGLFPAALLLTI